MNIVNIECESLINDNISQYGIECYIDLPSPWNEEDVYHCKGYFTILYCDGYHLRFIHKSEYHIMNLSFSCVGSIKNAFDILKKFNIKYDVNVEDFEKDFWK